MTVRWPCQRHRVRGCVRIKDPASCTRAAFRHDAARPNPPVSTWRTDGEIAGPCYPSSKRLRSRDLRWGGPTHEAGLLQKYQPILLPLSQFTTHRKLRISRKSSPSLPPAAANARASALPTPKQVFELLPKSLTLSSISPEYQVESSLPVKPHLSR